MLIIPASITLLAQGRARWQPSGRDCLVSRRWQTCVCGEHTGGCDGWCVLMRHVAAELVCCSSCLPEDPVRAGSAPDNTRHRYWTGVRYNLSIIHLISPMCPLTHLIDTNLSHTHHTHTRKVRLGGIKVLFSKQNSAKSQQFIFPQCGKDNNPHCHVVVWKHCNGIIIFSRNLNLVQTCRATVARFIAQTIRHKCAPYFSLEPNEANEARRESSSVLGFLPADELNASGFDS